PWRGPKRCLTPIIGALAQPRQTRVTAVVTSVRVACLSVTVAVSVFDTEFGPAHGVSGACEQLPRGALAAAQRALHGRVPVPLRVLAGEGDSPARGLQPIVAVRPPVGLARAGRA